MASLLASEVGAARLCLDVLRRHDASYSPDVVGEHGHGDGQGPPRPISLHGQIVRLPQRRAMLQVLLLFVEGRTPRLGQKARGRGGVHRARRASRGEAPGQELLFESSHDSKVMLQVC
jgi:hypothetical protein